MAEIIDFPGTPSGEAERETVAVELRDTQVARQLRRQLAAARGTLFASKGALRIGSYRKCRTQHERDNGYHAYANRVRPRRVLLGKGGVVFS
jgi:hypothetical protein